MDDIRFEGSQSYLDHAMSLEERRTGFDTYLRRIGKFVALERGTRIFEVGVGTGWFMVLCAARGFRASGLELNPGFAQHARELATTNGVDLDLMEGSIEDTDIGQDDYDIVFATSVFEHVRDWRRALERVYRALKPGGVLYFYSTNKFSLRSGEFPAVPLYGWLPDRARYALRVVFQGPSIITSSGVDFNQFTYFGLRRDFERVGFSEVYDMFEFLEPEDLANPTRLKAAVLQSPRRGPLRTVARIFASGTCFICVK